MYKTKWNYIKNINEIVHMFYRPISKDMPQGV